MDWDKLKDFKKKFHLAEAAAESLSKKNVGFNLKGGQDKEIEITLDVPAENEIARLATLLRPLIDEESPINFRKISQIFFENDLIRGEEREQLLKNLEGMEKGPVEVNIGDENHTASELYNIFANGEYFSNKQSATDKIEKFKRNYFLYRYVLYNFVSYNFDVYRMCVYLYLKIREIEEKQKEETAPQNVTTRNRCIYCLSESGSFTSEEHVYPESLGNTEIILPVGNVCDKCNNEVLSALDNYLVEHDAISLLRVLYVPYNTKTGKFPRARYQNMTVEKRHPSRIEIKQPRGMTKGFEVKQDGEEVKIKLQPMGRQRFDPEKLGRCLFKIALGIVCLKNGTEVALSPKYDVARKYISGQSSFPNNLLVRTNIIPSPTIEGQHWIGEKGTPVYMSIFGLVFFFNLEPEPTVRLSPEIESLFQCFPLSS